MKEDLKKVIIIIAFGIGIISFNTIKDYVSNEYFKCINFMSSHVQGNLRY